MGQNRNRYWKILVAVDGSETSLRALQESFRLGTSWITAVAVAPPWKGDLRLVGVNNVESVMREPCTTALAKAQELAHKAAVSLKPVCIVGTPHQAIVDLAETENSDLIVMGAKGSGFLERVLLGSVTRRVIGHTTRDVLVVPLHASLGWGKLLLATDGSPSSLAATARALELAQAHKAELQVLSVPEPASPALVVPEILEETLKKAEDTVNQVKVEAEALGLRVQAMVREGAPYKAITDQARKEQGDLIIMGSHGRTGLARLLMGSVTERVIGHAPCPVMVVKR